MADLVSNVGSWMATAALGWLAYQVTGSAAALGSVIAVKQVPAVLFGLGGGALADRLDVRRVLPLTQAAYATMSALLGYLVLSGHVTTWHLYLYAASTGLLSVVDGPSFGRLLAEVLGRRHLSHGIALGSVSHSTGWVLGLAAGAVLMAGPGAGVVFAIDAASFVFVAVTVLRLHAEDLEPLEVAGAGQRRVRDGLRHVLGSRSLVTLLAVAAVTGALGRHYQVTMAAMSHQVFGGGGALYGRLFLFFALGALLGAAVAARLPHLRLPVLLTAGAAAGLVQTLSGGAPTATVFGAAMVGAAGLNVVYDTAVSATVQHLAPGALRSRVLAVQGLVASVASLIGAPTLGWLADHLGARATLALAGTTAFLAVTTGALVLAGGSRALRRTLRDLAARRNLDGLTA